ncbi:MAG: ABC transporter substrate-binding protein [Gammaproteobacteria bacterium]|nr:ABC transporter substrate-binding protein [Gammaproteobacteria bacterium]MCP4880674.1 ABC transporter substrate-binding protein [Gammaproteobacteria bacterium]
MNKYMKGMVAAGAFALSQGAVAGCGEITMAEMNWASAELMANVDKIILEEGYGCEVELVPGATMTTFASMNEKGQPDVAGELWTNAVAEPLGVALGEGRLAISNDGPITQLGEGWFVPGYVQENHPELKTAMDILEHPELFPHPEDSSKGAFYGCPAGWGCQLANANLFRAFDMEAKGWLLVDPGSAAGLDGSIAKAVERGENWFGYYWSPTSMVGKYNLQLLDFGVPWGGSANWDGCIVKAEQDCADPQPSSWTESVVNTVVTSDFTANTDAMGYLSARVFPGPVMNGMLVYMADNQAGGEDAAIEFLLQHEDVWSAWVSADAAAKIKQSL